MVWQANNTFSIWNKVCLCSSSQLFAVQYSLSFTGARSFAAAPYAYKPLDVGLVLLSLGAGSIVGSVLGWSSFYIHTEVKSEDVSRQAGVGQITMHYA